MRRRVIFLVYEGFELLDLAGAASVFAAADHAVRGAYEVSTVSASGDTITSGVGIAVGTALATSKRVGRRDTVLVVGAHATALLRAMADERATGWLRTASERAERFGSVCSGTFLLAAAGVLEGRRAATHWSACQQLASLCPNTTVDPDSLYVCDGRMWTSAGVTTGIDMALAMVESDHGVELTRQIARTLVVSVHRPGHQSQFSAPLEAQKSGGGDFSALIAWIEAHLSEPITVPMLAERMHMSERTFHRRFKETVGMTPSRWVEQAKLDEARRLLEDGTPVQRVAGSVGFRSEAGFRTAFEGRFGLAPSLYRSMHA